MPDAPPIDPSAVADAYHVHRARRHARLRRARERRRARIRFWAVLTALIGLTVFLTVAVWQEIQRLFGL